MSEALNRLNRVSGIAALISKIVMVMMVITIAATCAAAVWSAVDPGHQILIDAGVTAKEVQALAVNTVIIAVIWIAILYLMDRLFMNIHRNNALFTEENVNGLRKIALLMVVFTVVATAAWSLTEYFVIESDSIMIDGSAPLGMLLVAFIVYILSLIFSYGAVLQKESDETL